VSAILPLEPPTTEELRQALARSFNGRVANDLQITARRPSAYQTSHALEELDVAIDGRTLPVLFKNLSRRGLHHAASDVKPEFLHDPLREIVMYQQILPHVVAGTARCHAAIVDDERERYWLFLEKVSGVELYQVGEIALWQNAARWLAVFHESTSGLASTVRSHLISYDGDYYRRWLNRARDFSKGPPASLDAAVMGFDDLTAGLAASPHGFVHGELYASNVLIDPSVDAPRVCPIDWEMAGSGPVLLDLAALTAGDWTDDNRAAIVEAYREASDSVRPMPRADFMRSLACCHAVLALQWLGWAEGWVPPKEHQRDWGAELEMWLARI